MDKVQKHHKVCFDLYNLHALAWTPQMVVTKKDQLRSLNAKFSALIPLVEDQEYSKAIYLLQGMANTCIEWIMEDESVNHSAVCQRMNQIYAQKNKDYGDSFSITFNTLGPISALVRIYDKLNRVNQLTQYGGRAVLDEAVEDTVKDMANYSVMTIMEFNEILADSSYADSMKSKFEVMLDDEQHAD